MDREYLREFAMSAVQELQERSEHFKELAKRKDVMSLGCKFGCQPFRSIL